MTEGAPQKATAERGDVRFLRDPLKSISRDVEDTLGGQTHLLVDLRSAGTYSEHSAIIRGWIDTRGCWKYATRNFWDISTLSKLTSYFASEAAINVSAGTVTAVRSGFRTVLSDQHGGIKLAKVLSGQLPYYYRKLESVVEDFESEHNALDLLIDLMATAPDSEKFRCSHGGEILASHYLEQKLSLKRLYSKLTMTTSENTNVHKMDGLFVDVSKIPFDYIFVEAKSSILPTEKTKSKSHRSGILRQMIDSLNGYAVENPRMEYIRIRENLHNGFDEGVRKRILADMRAPGPDLKFLGVSVTNAVTVNPEDDDFIMSEKCGLEFDYYAVVVTDLAALASDAFSVWDAVKAAAEAP